MATYNGILRFAEQDDGTNILQQGDYAADPQRTFGHQPGAARRILENKVLRQTSLASAGVAQFIADHQSEDVTDDMSTQQFADALGNAIASRSPGSAESVQITSGVKKLIEDNGGSIGATPAETAAALDSTVDAIAGDNADVKRSAAVSGGVTGYINGQGIPTPDPATPQLITSALTNAINQNIANDGGVQFANTTAQGVYVFCGNNGVQPPWPGEQGYGATAIGQAIGEAVTANCAGSFAQVRTTNPVVQFSSEYYTGRVSCSDFLIWQGTAQMKVLKMYITATTSRAIAAGEYPSITIDMPSGYTYKGALFGKVDFVTINHGGGQHPLYDNPYSEMGTLITGFPISTGSMELRAVKLQFKAGANIQAGAQQGFRYFAVAF